jgi:flagellar motor switch protein FliM
VSNSSPISQQELDSLLAALAAASEEAKPTRGRRGPVIHEASIYDFAQAKWLSAGTIQALEPVWSSFAHAASVTLAAYLRTPVRLSLLSTEQVSYEQFVRSVHDPTVIAVFEMSPLPGSALIELNPSLAFWIVDHLLGGKGEILDSPRPLTPMENALVEDALSRMLADFGKAWPEPHSMEPNLKNLFPSAAAAQVAKPEETVLVACFELVLDSLVGLVSICIPVSLLKLAEIGANSRAAAADETPQDPPSLKRRLAASLLPVPLACSVSLGAVTLSLAELTSLRQGDVICLDKPSSDPLDFLIGGIPAFRCRAIIAAGALAAQLTHDLRPSSQGREEATPS